ncbi:MAG: hypothetical protein J2P54_09410, partial [Bradyrhizobiaceae bacterium]|nr:hypothetical protein [Bradyrhizobiaceae bacterium]
LPKTRSGKILRGTMKKIADGEQWSMPATIDDPAILGEIGAALRSHNVGREAETERASNEASPRAAGETQSRGS